MEPRIATLLGDSAALERATLDPISLLPPPSIAPRRPLPVEPRHVSEDARAKNAAHRSEYIGNDQYVATTSGLQGRQKSSVPIAEVLNNEASTNAIPQSLPGLATGPSTSATAQFSGRLSDILVDPSQQHPNKRRRVDHATPPALTGADKLKLPKLPQPPKKSPRRPRIPPLLQGLHQPPPLPPEGRLFPPITGEGGGFGRDIGDRVGLRSPITQDNSKDKGKATESSPTTTSNASRTEKVAQPHETRLAPANDKENQTSEKSGITVEKGNEKVKEAKKRKKWSEQETKDLLHGVSRFGIGNWKKILNCPDFSFNQRTAVDLKDRFRTCCPGEGLKSRASKTKNCSKEVNPDPHEGASSSTSNVDSSSQDVLPTESSIEQPQSTRKQRGDNHRKGPVELAEMGIQAPFFKTKRRQRREFTEKDDENLLKGFEKYGATWHSMRDDKELGFGTRHPTDLRDRFRIRYPEMYAKAGYKLKPKDEQMLKEKEEAASQEIVDNGTAEQKSDATKGSKKITAPEVQPAPPTTTSTSISGLRAHALLQPLMNSLPASFDDFPDLVSEDDGDHNRSPITLNRNIFEWADANPSSTNSNAAASNNPAVSSLTGELIFNLPGMDGMHIDPRAILDRPISSIVNSGLSAIPSYPANMSSLSTSIPMNTINTTTLSSAPALANTSTVSKQNVASLLRTPNLPTIVFPHVPVASARNAMHNLPPPADLLSGLDVDMRSEPQTAGFVLDDGLGLNFALPAGAPTLAPLVGTTTRGLFTSDRGLLDEPFGERSVLNSGI